MKPLNSRDNAHIACLVLEHGALLDVGFDIGKAAHAKRALLQYRQLRDLGLQCAFHIDTVDVLDRQCIGQRQRAGRNGGTHRGRGEP